MIRLHRLDGKEFVLNADLIETVEATPDTVLSLTTGRKLVVRESVDEVVRRVIRFQRRRSLLRRLPACSPSAAHPSPPAPGH